MQQQQDIEAFAINKEGVVKEGYSSFIDSYAQAVLQNIKVCKIVEEIDYSTDSSFVKVKSRDGTYQKVVIVIIILVLFIIVKIFI